MKSDKKILIAFFLNGFFSLIEFIGSVITGSVAVFSDAIHDFGDCVSIGVSYILEKVSKKPPDNSHTYGYLRYSLLGSIITTVVLLAGSLAAFINSIKRIINPIEINYDGVILLAAFGACVNFIAAYFTHGGNSLNQKAVNLHMLEDVLGWIVVLVGAVAMKFTKLYVIDPILSILVAIFIFANAIKNLKSAIDIFLEKTPGGIDVEEIKQHLLRISDVLDVHHIHIRTIDGYLNYATLHVVAEGKASKVKSQVKEELAEHGISHATVEIEEPGEICSEPVCKVEHKEHHHH